MLSQRIQREAAAKVTTLLLLVIAASAQRSTERLRSLSRQLETPDYDEQGESFERLGSVPAGDVQTNLKQLLARQLSGAVEPLVTAPLLAVRQPALRFESNESSEEEEQQEEDEEEESEPQPEPEPEYNPWRDNFYDLNTDGTYVYGYSLPQGVRRYERNYYTDLGPVVEGFYTQPRQMAQGLRYELRCYRSDARGYHPLRVEYLARPPRVQRDETPNVDCFDH